MGGFLFGGGGQNTHTYDKKVEALRIQSSSYNMPITLLWGKNRVSVMLFDYIDFTAHEHTETQRTGGKGGGGGSQSRTTYTYSVAVVCGLCEGSITGIDRVWVDKDCTTFDKQETFSLFKGEENQAPWSYMKSTHPDRALNYAGFAYVAGVYDLGDNPSLPNINLEAEGALQLRILGKQGELIQDAAPDDILKDFLTNPVYGAGFPSDYIDDWSLYHNYCMANGLFLSPMLTESSEAHEFLNFITQITNAEVVWSNGKLKIIPYGDSECYGHGFTYSPDMTPIYDLNDDDFIVDDPDSEDPVTCDRGTASDAYNSIPISFTNRNNNYVTESFNAQDAADIEDKGIRPGNNINLDNYVCVAETARLIGQIIVQKSVHIRNVYEFKLGWKYVLLEPMDLVTISDSGLGLERELVRILSIEENEEGTLTVTAAECLVGVATAAKYSHQEGLTQPVNYQVEPGNTSEPIFMPAPPQLTSGGLEIWAALGGGEYWGGCDIWASEDDATYKQIGTIAGKARRGILNQNIAEGAKLDTANSLFVTMDSTAHQLPPASTMDVENKNTLIYVGGEYMAYANSELQDKGQYKLDYLGRGLYGTPISAHNADSSFVRIDDKVFKYAFVPDRLDATIYLKFPAFNIFGVSAQTLDEVSSFPCTLTYIKPPQVKNIVIDEDTYVRRDGTKASDISIEFEVPEDYDIFSRYDIYYEENKTTSWQYAGSTVENDYRIIGITSLDILRVRIVTVNKFDHKSDPVFSGYYVILNKNRSPSDVKGFKYDPVDDGIRLTWQHITDGDLEGYNIYQCEWGQTLPEATKIASLVYANNLFVPIGSEVKRTKFFIEAVDFLGQVSVNAAFVDVSMEFPPPVEGFDVIRNDSYVLFKWLPVPLPNVRYEIRRGDAWEIGEVLLTNIIQTSVNLLFPIPGEHTFWIKAIDQYGSYSGLPSFASTNLAPLSERNAIHTIDQVANQWKGSDLNMEIVGGGFQLVKDVFAGEHIVEVVLDKKFMARNWIDYKMVAIPVDLYTWKDAIFAWTSIEAQTPWFPAKAPDGGMSVRHQISVYKEIPKNIIENLPLNNNLIGEILKKTPTINKNTAFKLGRFAQGIYINDLSRLTWEFTEIPSIFNTGFFVALKEGIFSSCYYMIMSSTNGNLYIGYDKALDVFFAQNAAGLQRLEAKLDFRPVDYIRFAFVQTAEQRKLYVSSVVTEDSQQAIGNYAPIGAFNKISLNI